MADDCGCVSAHEEFEFSMASAGVLGGGPGPFRVVFPAAAAAARSSGALRLVRWPALPLRRISAPALLFSRMFSVRTRPGPTTGAGPLIRAAALPVLIHDGFY